MAQPAAPPPRPRQLSFVRLVALILLGLIAVVGIAVVIAWLAVRPRHLVYTVEDATVHGFGLSADRRHVNATFYVALRAYNPNTRVSIYYDAVEAYVGYGGQTLAFETAEPFFQGHRDARRLELAPAARDAALAESAGRDLAAEKESGQVELEVRVRARIRFKVGALKTRHRTLRVFCIAAAHFSRSKAFERTQCDVDY